MCFFRPNVSVCLFIYFSSRHCLCFFVSLGDLCGFFCCSAAVPTQHCMRPLDRIDLAVCVFAYWPFIYPLKENLNLFICWSTIFIIVAQLIYQANKISDNGWHCDLKCDEDCTKTTDKNVTNYFETLYKRSSIFMLLLINFKFSLFCSRLFVQRRFK